MANDRSRKERAVDEARPARIRARRGNVNPNAQSAESARKLGDAVTYSINEPPPGAPKPFKVPEDHTATSPETLRQDYPDGYGGYVPPQPPEEPRREGLERFVKDHTDDPDDLEGEIDQARRDGDFKPMHRHPSPRKKRK